MLGPYFSIFCRLTENGGGVKMLRSLYFLPLTDL
jgi:hypothetical protein